MKAAVALLVLLGSLLVALPASARAEDPRYALAGGCYELRSVPLGRAVAADAGPFRLQATDLGRYLLFGAEGRMPAAGDGDRVVLTRDPGPRADFVVESRGDAFRLFLPAAGDRALAAAADGTLVLVPPGRDDAATRFAFAPADGCAAFPEAGVGATGTPARGATPFGEVRGLLDAHLHGMAFEFIGGRVRCGRPWHPYGVTKALVDCPDHEPGGTGAALENFQSYGTPARAHDTTGWPTFRDWPAWGSLTHEQVYFRWLERAWRGGLRLAVNLLVDNAVLCEVYPYKQSSCNEMDGIRLQLGRIRELQDYIDAQSGGPGKGWLRLVDSPGEARRTINAGKLAVVLGIEVSNLFDCGTYNGVAECGREQIDRQLDFFHRAGVRQVELVNKFDNALSGVAGDAGVQGPIINAGNRYETGRFWDMRTCHGHAHDREQPTLPSGPSRDVLAGDILQLFLPRGAAPVYPAPPHCNALGLSDLGEHLVRRMVEKGMLVDPDHMSVRARDETMTLLESLRHPGVISSHSWSTPDSFPRIYALGGMVTPMARDSTGFVRQWRELRVHRDRHGLFGFGFGSDINGFAKQGSPRPGAAAAGNAVQYPFRSADGAVVLDRNRAGARTWDVNVDGVAHYGLYPDWVEDLRRQAGGEIARDMVRGAEAYLQMWERAEGIGAPRCRPARTRLTRRGLGDVRLGLASEALLRSAGQPHRRPGRAWTWCVQRRDGRGGRVTSVLTRGGRTALIASTGREHEALGVGPGDRMGAVRAVGARRVAPGVHVRDAGGRARYVFVVRRGRVRATGVTSARTTRGVRALLREARLG